MQFDFISLYYDRLSKLVFGAALENAKTSLYANIPNGAKLLFVGGGTGLPLLTLLSKNQNLKIDFVDSSNKMIAIAKKRTESYTNVKFHTVDIKQFAGDSYDFIITEFFFDLFTKDSCVKLIASLSKKLNRNGVWIDTDFRKPQNIKSRLILKSMYQFFKIFAKVETNILVNTMPIFEAKGYRIKKERKFNSGFISSQLIAAI